MREGEKLGITTEDVNRVIRNSYRDAVAQKRKDVHTEDSKKGLDFKNQKLDEMEVAAAAREGREPSPAAKRRMIERMKGTLGETGYKQKALPTEKAIQFEDKSEGIEDRIKISEQALEDLDIKENRAYTDWVDAGVKKEATMKANKKKARKESSDKIKDYEAQVDKIKRAQLEELERKRRLEGRPKSLKKKFEGAVLDPIEKGVKTGWDFVFGGKDYQ